ncbi:transposable element Tcb1 transposase [Trichonephila clavipes]|nr:transposable element Tcb1 transposase [Trichonephila clavipes]
MRVKYAEAELKCFSAITAYLWHKGSIWIICYEVELLDDWNVDVPSCQYPRNLESPSVSSPGFGNDSKMMVVCLGYIGLYARRPVRCVPRFATHCRLRLTWSREHALWTPQQWSCVMFSDESRTELHLQSLTIAGHIYRDVILEQHLRLFRDAMGAEFLFMDDNARPHRANIVDECLQSDDITRMD